MTISAMVKSLIFLVLLALSAIAGREYAEPIAGYLTDVRDFSARDARISKRLIAYRIPGEKPLSFAFSRPATQAKILLHPAVGEGARSNADGFVYAVRVRLFGAGGEALASHDIYLHADSPDQVFASGERWRFFRTRPELVAGQDQLVIESPSPAARIEISTLETDPQIVGVDLRLFEQRPFLGSQSIAAFRRLSEGVRSSLTEPNAFPDEMLSREEIFYLGRNLWRAVGPTGLDKRDYQALVLYEASRSTELTGAGGLP